jgi:putative ABC transport system permease protein
MNVLESISIALTSVKTHKIRAGLTLLSISIGVFTIVAIGSIVSALEYTVTEEMNNLGDNSFAIFRMPKIQMGGGEWRKYR